MLFVPLRNKNNPQLCSCFPLSSELILCLASLHSSHCFAAFKPFLLCYYYQKDEQAKRGNLPTRWCFFLYTPRPPEISFFSFAIVFPFVKSSTVSYVRRLSLSHPSKTADWKIEINKRGFVCKKLRNVNRGLTDKRHARFELYLTDYIWNIQAC